ncbi:TPA: hypothetical protein HA265_01780 [Candidatus Woesearchaeota archaeon]|nr:hypothetical protein [Candidatus Woesearchaeota archaeon]
MAENSKKSDAFLRVGSAEMLHLKKIMFELVDTGKYDRNEPEIRKILKEATEALKRLK